MLLQPRGDLLLWTEPPRYQGVAVARAGVGGGVSGQPRLSQLTTAGQSVLPYCQEHPGLHLLPGSPRSRLSREGQTLGMGRPWLQGSLHLLLFCMPLG